MRAFFVGRVTEGNVKQILLARGEILQHVRTQWLAERARNRESERER